MQADLIRDNNPIKGRVNFREKCGNHASRIHWTVIMVNRGIVVMGISVKMRVCMIMWMIVIMRIVLVLNRIAGMNGIRVKSHVSNLHCQNVNSFSIEHKIVFQSHPGQPHA
jgi:hypothetical protein